MIDETFSVQPGEALHVDVAHGDVHIEKSTGNEARIRVVLEGQEITDRLRNFFEYLNFEVGQTDGAVFVRTDPEGNWSWTRNGWRLRGGIHVYISVPELFDADIDVAHGDVDIHALKGVLNMDLAHGDINAESLSGPSLSMDIAHGDVQTGEVGSERVRLNLRHGDLSVHSMDARTMHADIAHGDIELNRVAAETVRIRTAHGDIDLDRLDAGEIDVDISHGDIHVQSMSGYPRMDVHHGDISLYFVEAAGGKFNAAHGDIDLYAPAQATLDVDLRASDVSMADAFQTRVRGHAQEQGSAGPDTWRRSRIACPRVPWRRCAPRTIGGHMLGGERLLCKGLLLLICQTILREFVQGVERQNPSRKALFAVLSWTSALKDALIKSAKIRGSEGCADKE